MHLQCVVDACVIAASAVLEPIHLGISLGGFCTDLTSSCSDIATDLQVLDMLEQDDAVRQALPVVCANHPDHVSKITDAKHFDTFVRDGGCSRQCQARMPCGHTCPR